MPPSLGTLGLTPSQKVLYQKERNRLKQRAHRERRKAEKEGGVVSSTVPSSTLSPSSSSSSGLGSATGRQRGRKYMVLARKAFDDAQGQGGGRAEGVRFGEEGQEGSETREMVCAAVEEVEMTSGPSSSVERERCSPPATTTTVPRTNKLSSVSLFATLLNGGSLPRPTPPSTSSALAVSSSSNLLFQPPLRQPFPPSPLSSSSSSGSTSRHHLSLQQDQPSTPEQSQLGSTLPSYTFLSPVNIGSSPFYNPLSSIDWKWRLFQLHAVLHQDRDDPVKGYLHSSVAEQTITTTQTLILNLLAATSPPGRKQMLDSQRYLSPEDQQYLKVTRMDPRIEWMPDPLVRLNATKAMSMGLVNLTERFAKGIEQSTLFGDPMDSGAWKFHDASLSPVSPDTIVTSAEAALMNCEGGPELYGRTLHGATIREIVLGLELPGWRTEEIIQPPSTWFEDERDQFLRRRFT